MPKTYYRTGNYKVDHSTFGGVILPSDYDTGHSGSRNMDIAAYSWKNKL